MESKQQKYACGRGDEFQLIDKTSDEKHAFW